ncbi:unnamed protein product [Cuscuta epithymum]|uniref:Uncharacterized protein n=1 Tax=Cuscuta epithymum TaxID=186058 RepID=A0AAV0DMC5_9ASTE|nr:unnamed protein product [Cuscuta epithymum]
MKEEKPEVVGFAVRAAGRGKPSREKTDKSGIVCSYCKFTGHEAANCFEILGYPDWWGDRPRLGINKKPGAGRGKASSLAESGRMSGPTGGSGKSHVRAHAAAAGHAPSTERVAAEFNNNSAPLPGFTADQWKTLVAVFGNPQTQPERMSGPSLEEADWHG